jgi:hypothetical protein
MIWRLLGRVMPDFDGRKAELERVGGVVQIYGSGLAPLDSGATGQPSDPAAGGVGRVMRLLRTA